MNKFHKYLFFLVVLTSLLIVWGAVVRTTGSGLGCPDWPLCFGQIIPPFRKDVLIEYFHRLLAALVGLLTLVITLRIWFQRELRKRLGVWATLALIVLLLQAGLGGVTVRTELHPHIVATHLGMALIFLALIFYMFLLLKNPREKMGIPKSGWYRLSHTCLTLLFFQIVLGGLVAASNAGLACPDFPTCLGQWFPSVEGPVALHFYHRMGAVLVLLFVLTLVVGTKHLFSVRLIFIMAFIQILLGIGNVVMQLPIAVRIAHNAVAVLLFLALMQSTYELRRSLK